VAGRRLRDTRRIRAPVPQAQDARAEGPPQARREVEALSHGCELVPVARGRPGQGQGLKPTSTTKARRTRRDTKKDKSNIGSASGKEFDAAGLPIVIYQL